MSLRQTIVGWVAVFGWVMLLQASATVDVSAQSVRYPNDGYDWVASPDGRNVLDCFGNCGAGCSEFPNPCGGSPQYWELQITSAVTHVRDFKENKCEHDGGVGFVEGQLYSRSVGLYRASGVWAYHGLVADLCRSHDTHCRGIWQIWGVKELWCYGVTGIIALGRAEFGCANAFYVTWDYPVSTIYGYRRGPWRSTGETCRTSGDTP